MYRIKSEGIGSMVRKTRHEAESVGVVFSRGSSSHFCIVDDTTGNTVSVVVNGEIFRHVVKSVKS